MGKTPGKKRGEQGQEILTNSRAAAGRRLACHPLPGLVGVKSWARCQKRLAGGRRKGVARAREILPILAPAPGRAVGHDQPQAGLLPPFGLRLAVKGLRGAKSGREGVGPLPAKKGVAASGPGGRAARTRARISKPRQESMGGA